MTPFQHSLIIQNQRLVHRLAQKYRRRPGVEYDDLVGAGMIGLTDAARLFDPNRGFKFSTYAWPAITRRMQALFDRRRPPAMASLDATDEMGAPYRDLIPAPPGPELGQREDVKTYLAGLPPRHRAIVRMRFGLDGKPPRTLLEIGKHFGFTRERARQILNKSMERLRAAAGAEAAAVP